MASYLDIFIFSFVGSMFAFTSALLFIAHKKTAKILATYATPFAAGALLAAVFFDLLPEAISESSVDRAMLGTIIGLITFFYLERFLRWFHHHEHSNINNLAPKSLVVVGDTIHNALDGVVIASAFLVSIPAGLVAVVAIAAHEVPNEIGNIGYLLSRGMSRKNAIIVDALSVISTVTMALVIYVIGSTKNLPLGLLLSISAGFLLYIAASDMIPLVHRESKNNILDIRPLLLLIGVLIVGFIIIVTKSL
jgi:zinc and cadmium transporter